MSASIDKGPGGSDEDSREVLSTWLDDYIAGRCDRAEMHESFLKVCRSNPEAPWDALALLDQYQRRGRVDVALARSLKSEIAQLVFGVANQTEEPRESNEATLDTTGSRWRKLYAERVGPVNDDQSVEDPAFRRDFDPQTRPPPMARRPLQKDSSPTRDIAASGGPVGVGSVLRDRYELMEVVGVGRAGTVYRAFDRHRSHLPSPSCYVAVRVLQLPREGREAALAEIERQAYEAQSLSHPNIVSVFDLDRHLEGYFVIMELLEGETLAQVMQRLAGRPLSRERAVAVIGAIGAALAHAHQRHIAHGDIKPASVVLTKTGDIKLLDFGFARSHSLDQWVGGEPTLEGGGANSTAAYASTERVGGEEPQPRDDVYSLAVIAYELISGRHPFGGRSAPLARAHGRAPQKITGLSGRGWHTLQNALNWTPAERRVDVSELVAALGGVEVAQPLPPLSSIESGKPLDNPFGRGKGVLLAFAFVAIAGGIAWWQLPRLIEPTQVMPIPGPAGAGVERAASSAAVMAPPVVKEEAIKPPERTPPVDAIEPKAQSPAQVGGAIVSGTVDQPDAAAEVPRTTAGPGEAREPARAPEREAERETAPASRPAAGGRASVEFDKDTYVATESDGLVKLTVRRNGSTREAARFRWALRPNSAEAGSDFAAIGPDVEEIPAGSRTVTLTIPLVSDVVAENTELFLVELESVENGPALGEQAHAAVIVVDDD